ncbi:MAG: hypothetical protein HYS12_23155 [Planctomycetes bacterium]|nr:hypothetical protein [Planctomycetota bacterium]
MKGILADINVEGQVSILMLILESEAWRDVWDALKLSMKRLGDLALPPNTSDAIIWQTCQDQQLVLITGNRNDDGPDSLEATLREQNSATSLPVITLADPEAVRHSRAYADQTVERLLDYLLDIDNYRGTGRLYVP